jgi:hypothetical protein
MKKISLKDNRKIKKYIIKLKKDEIKFNPLTLDYNMNENEDGDDIYITRYFFDKNKEFRYDTLEKINDNYDEKKFMLTPSLLIPTSELLKIYNVTDIKEFIISNLDNNNFSHINRILNCWIRENFNDLKKNNNILIDIYYKLFSIFFKNIDIEKKVFIKEFKHFLDRWFMKKTINTFNINLGNDFEKYLSNKYD